MNNTPNKSPPQWIGYNRKPGANILKTGIKKFRRVAKIVKSRKNF